ncbi:alpha/beta hydrolase [Galbibacter mesophilus]|uniref:alpha/beta hydrolase n=1 Tax=Galbibacter mesophilus TaxID=379069 RepID=UPI00191F7196|nr:alpha/beta hydrolase [Galbibacter mesophilus]MCM5662856.1 alpha/beta hydrolase [Galbibacter mesophilus]
MSGRAESRPSFEGITVKNLSTPFEGIIRIKRSSKNYVIVLIFTFFIWQLSAQERFKDIVYKEVSSKTFTYKDTLQLDFYDSDVDSKNEKNKFQLVKKPLLMLVHGGGFASGKRDNPLEKKFCEDMARRGYAVASISYHLARKGKSFGCDYASEGKTKTFDSVTEDIVSATKFLQEKSSELEFDPNKIILVGSSAGAEAVLNTVFVENKHQGIHYAGVVSFAGAVISLDGLTNENAVPSIFFHGEKDNLVPYGVAPHHFCKEDAPGYLLLYGPEAMSEKLEALGESYLLVHDPNGNHDWANIGYRYTQEIANFVAETIIKGNKIQSNLEIIAKK